MKPLTRFAVVIAATAPLLAGCPKTEPSVPTVTARHTRQLAPPVVPNTPNPPPFNPQER